MKKKDHPFDYDFQVLELSEALKFDENIQPIKLAHIEDMVIGKVVTVTGWGNTDENVSFFNLRYRMCANDEAIGTVTISRKSLKI